MMTNDVQLKRVLIVDDEPNVSLALAEYLEDLGEGYIVEMAETGDGAWEKIQQSSYALIVTDLRMPGINGIELIERIRATSQQTPLILMTAYGSEEVEVKARRFEVYRYLTKPFPAHEFADVVRQAVSQMDIAREGVFGLSEEGFKALNLRLENLRCEIEAQCIILADSTGQIITYVGVTTNLEQDVLMVLVGGSFATTLEMARHLGQEQAINLNYQDGERHEVYSSNIGDKLFMTILYDKKVQSSSIGMVWLYIKRAIEDLLKIISEAELAYTWEVLDIDFQTSSSKEVDDLVDGDFVRIGDRTASSGNGAGSRIKKVNSQRLYTLEEVRANDIISRIDLANMDANEPTSSGEGEN